MEKKATFFLMPFLLMLFYAAPVYADVSVAPTSGLYTDSFTLTFDTDKVYLFAPNGNNTYGSFATPGTYSQSLSDLAQPYSPGTFTFVQTTDDANCGAGQTMLVCTLANPTATTTTYELTAPATTTETYIPKKQEWLFMFGLFTFFSGVKFFSSSMTITSGRYGA